jgi:hypothetical protein
MFNRICVAIVVIAALAAIECTSPTVPTQPKTSATMSLSGTVFVHSADGIVPAAQASVWGWQEDSVSGGGQTTGTITTNDQGRYVMNVGTNILRVRVTAATSTGVSYQPCAITLTPTAGLTRDVHVITDMALLGAHLPEALLEETPLLTGQVFETTADGRHPLANVWLTLNGLYGDDLILARTLTDSDGRFIFCDVPFAPSLFLWASKDGYEDFGRGNLEGAALEIEMRAK